MQVSNETFVCSLRLKFWWVIARKARVRVSAVAGFNGEKQNTKLGNRRARTRERTTGGLGETLLEQLHEKRARRGVVFVGVGGGGGYKISSVLVPGISCFCFSIVAASCAARNISVASSLDAMFAAHEDPLADVLAL